MIQFAATHLTVLLRAVQSEMSRRMQMIAEQHLYSLLILAS